MKFKLSNIGKLKSAELVLNGITVIVGDNNSGKTTVSRALYAYFSSLYNIDGEVLSQRKAQVHRVLRSFYDAHRRPLVYGRALHDVIEDYFSDGTMDPDGLLRRFLNDYFSSRATTAEIDNAVDSAAVIRRLPNKLVRHQIIENYFDTLFRGQYVSQCDGVTSGEICADINNREIKVLLKPGATSYESDVNIQQRAYFIDTPDLLNFWGSYNRFSVVDPSWGLNYSIRREINRCINNEESPADSAFDDLLYISKYQEFLSEISNVIKGRFSFDKNNILKFSETYEDGTVSAPFDLVNVSEGLKAFGVLELLLRHRVIRQGDILILDEPEVHLHPEWLIEYAKIIVDLQKVFGLTILITTHSSNFLLAIQFLAKMAGRSSVVNSYRIKSDSEDKRRSVVASANPFDWDDSYIAFIKAVDKLNDLHQLAYGE